MKYQVLKLTVPHSFRTEGSPITGSGKAKPGIFINKSPRIAIPLKESRRIIRSDWLTGAARFADIGLVVDMLVFVLVVIRPLLIRFLRKRNNALR